MSKVKTQKEAFFLFPEFFQHSLLDVLKRSPYSVNMSTKYLGDVSKGSKWVMTFGISPKGYIHFWLGDLMRNLDENDIDVFMKHRALPDRLGKHFFKSQMEGQFVGDEDEN